MGCTKLVSRHVEQRLIAQQQVQHDPGSGRAEHDRAQHRRVHVAHHFFEREQHRGDGRIERSREAAEAPTGTSALTLAVLKPQPPAQYRGDPAATCTDGPSRPSAMPLASDAAHMPNLPITVRRLM